MQSLLDGLVLEVKDGKDVGLQSMVRQLTRLRNVRLQVNTQVPRQLLTIGAGLRGCSSKMSRKPSDCASMVPISQWKAEEAIDMVRGNRFSSIPPSR